MVWKKGSWDDFRDEGEEGGEEVGDRQVQDEVVHPTHLQVASFAVPLFGGQSEGDLAILELPYLLHSVKCLNFVHKKSDFLQGDPTSQRSTLVTLTISALFYLEKLHIWKNCFASGQSVSQTNKIQSLICWFTLYTRPKTCLS